MLVAAVGRAVRFVEHVLLSGGRRQKAMAARATATYAGGKHDLSPAGDAHRHENAGARRRANGTRMWRRAIGHASATHVRMWPLQTPSDAQRRPMKRIMTQSGT